VENPMSRKIEKNKVGTEILYERVDSTKIRISCNKTKVYTAKDWNDEYILFDFEGGPVLTRGGKLEFDSMDYVIERIEQTQSQYEDMLEVYVHLK
jgi:hypothetical protein